MESPTTIVDKGDAIELTMHLGAIGELFTAPEFDPFTAQTRTTSGIDDLVAHLGARRLRRKPKVKTTIILPADQVTPGLAKEVDVALDRYCERATEETRRTMAVSRFEGTNKLPIGLTVALITFLIALVVVALLPEGLRQLSILLTPIITVTVWVAIWNPVETLLYESWSDRRILQVYKTIRAMEIVIQPA
jgi:hypothetical protein